MQKPSIPKGTRDFSPNEMVRRNYIFDSIKSVFQKYGYMPLETPAMENLSTLLGKYGDEGDRLIFKIFPRGAKLKKLSREYENLSRENMDDETKGLKLASSVAEEGLRYDLTVPFARYVVQNQHEVTFPFKRYQIQPVWRADRPQKGRYREFYQCDVDVIGSKSLLNELELVHIIKDVFEKLGINVTTRLNNRKILYGIAEVTGSLEKFMDITIAIDKLDKTGLENVLQELEDKELSKDAISTIKKILEFKANSNSEKLDFLKNMLAKSETAMQGIQEMDQILEFCRAENEGELFELDLTLARGLNYYTGTIFEVVANDVKMGSICGGGRYDDLTGIFGLKDVSGVGISFGADRIYDVMNELDLFPDEIQSTTQLLLVNFGEEEALHCLKLITEFRKAGIKTELYPDAAKMKKQMTYANKLNIPFVLMVGEEEIKTGNYTLKDMKSGEQQILDVFEILKYLNGHLVG